MNHRVSITAVGLLLVAAATLCAFGLNYNASKSNTGNIVVHPDSVSEAQASAILAAIEKNHQPPTEAAVQGYAKAAGVKPGVIKSIIIESNQGKTSVLLLADPADEKTARGAANTSTSRSNQQHN